MLKIEGSVELGDRYAGANFGIVDYDLDDIYRLEEGDIVTLCRGSIECPLESPECLWEEFISIPWRAKVLLGRVGTELTFWDKVKDDSWKNLTLMLFWADEVFGQLGSRLVLSLTDFDIFHDVEHGGRLMKWAAERKVVLIVMSGWRWCFTKRQFAFAKHMDRAYPYYGKGDVAMYPYKEVKSAIAQTGVEIWIGAGTYEGLIAGVEKKALAAGIKGIIADKAEWELAGG